MPIFEHRVANSRRSRAATAARPMVVVGGSRRMRRSRRCRHQPPPPWFVARSCRRARSTAIIFACERSRAARSDRAGHRHVGHHNGFVRNRVANAPRCFLATTARPAPLRCRLHESCGRRAVPFESRRTLRHRDVLGRSKGRSPFLPFSGRGAFASIAARHGGNAPRRDGRSSTFSAARPRRSLIIADGSVRCRPI